MPVSIASVIVYFQISNEYSWYGRQKEALNEGNFAIVKESSRAEFWRPWSYFFPAIDTLTVINLDHITPVEGKEGRSRSYLISLTPHGQVNNVLFQFDCKDSRFAPDRDDESQIEWAEMPAEVLLAVCGVEE